MRILVVEDEHKIANSVKRGLEMEGFAVDVAYDGEDGYDLAETEEYAAIILDIMLPKMDGITVCKKLRTKSIHSPILMLTARGELEDKVSGLDSGADDYLVKPFAFAELVARIKALTRRPQNSYQDILKVESLTLNTTSYEVKRNDTPISLTKREYSLLEFLMRHTDKVLTKDQIIGNVWNYDADVLANTVEVYVGYLRNKIDKPFPNFPALIHTVRGFGYKIGVEK